MMNRKFYFLLFTILSPFILTAQIKRWSLRECINYGVEKNLSIRQNMLQQENHKLYVRDAALSLLPSVNGISPGINYSFGRNIDPETNTYTTTRYTSVGGFALSTGITIFAGFSNINRLRMARLAELSGMEQAENQANQLAIQIMNAFFSLVYAEEQVRITREQVENAQLQRKKVEHECRLGKRAQSDLYDIQAQQAADEYRLISVQNNYDNALMQLIYLMNYEEKDPLQVDISSVDIPLPEHRDLPVENIYQHALRNLPEIRLANQAVRSSRLNLSINKASLWPSLYVSGNFSLGSYSNQRDGSILEQIKDHNRIGKGFSVSINIPLYAGLNKRSGVKRAKNNLEISELQYLQAERTLYKEIKRAVQELESCRQHYQVAIEREKFSTLSYEAARKRFDLKLSSIIDLNTTSNNLLEARYNVLRAKLDYIFQKMMIDFYRGETALQDQVKVKHQ